MFDEMAILHHLRSIRANQRLMLRMLARLLKDDATLLEEDSKLMATLDDILADVSAESSQIDGVTTLISGLEQQIADALSGTTIPPAVQAKIDAAFAGMQTNDAKIAAALAANVPPAPTTTAAP